MHVLMKDLASIKTARTKRISSYDVEGRNDDAWNIAPGETRTLADIKGPGCITHLWMTQSLHYRDVLLKITWDDAGAPSILVPLGDFFCLGHGLVNSFQSLLFTASTRSNNGTGGCALNCYALMPFKTRALVQLVNESKEIHRQYFYVDYELYEGEQQLAGLGYFHAEFRRENPFGGWAHEILVNHPEADIVNKEMLAWNNNYVLLEAKGKGHYIGCNISITNFQGTWWGEGDDMIWVDGYKWPPDLHGTGSEDYLNQAWGMQTNAFMRNGSSLHEENTGGYQTSYIFHVENPVRFTKEVKVTIEHGHGNHLRNEVASVAYFYLESPAGVKQPPPVEQRRRVPKEGKTWVQDPAMQVTSREVPLNDEMQVMKRRWKSKSFKGYAYATGTLSVDQEGQVCIGMQIARENPQVYEIPVAEIIEDFIHKKVKLDIETGAGVQSKVGTLVLDTMGILHLEVTGEDGCTVLESPSLDTLVKEFIGKTTTVEALLDFESSVEPDPAKGPYVMIVRRASH